MTPERQAKIEKVAQQRQLDLAVVLENVHDPHNIGAVLRSCDAVGVTSVYAMFTTVDLFPSKLYMGKKSSSGSRKWVDVFVYTDPHKCMEDVLERYGRVLATSLEGGSESLYTADFTQPTAILLGNEHSGVSSEMLNYCEGSIYIPQMGMSQSLNISVACAVTLYECLRQRDVAGMYDTNTSGSQEELSKLLDDYVARHDSGHKGRSTRRVE